MHRFQNILLYLPQGAAHEDPAVVRAARLARRSGAMLTLVDTHSTASGWRGRARGDTSTRASRWRRLESVANALGDVSVHFRVWDGAALPTLLEKLAVHDFDLVMKSARGDKFGPFDFGSVARGLVREAPVPVWVVGREQTGAYRRILAAARPAADQPLAAQLDERVLELAMSLAQADDADLHVVHAWDAFGERLIAARADPLSARYYESINHHEASRALARAIIPLCRAGHMPKTHLRKGAPERVICQVHGEVGADLLVMGTVGRSGLSGLLLGNTAESVLRTISGSVLVVKPGAVERVIALPYTQAS